MNQNGLLHRMVRGMLRVSIPRDDREAILGDLEESYRSQEASFGRTTAQLWFIGQAVRSVPLFIFYSLQNGAIMILNFIKLSFRGIVKRKGFAAINIVGLAVGLASALIIFVYIQHESSYDNFHRNSDSIYRVNWDYKWQGNEGIGSGTPPPLANRLLSDYPQVESAVRIFPVSAIVVRQTDRSFVESRIWGVDSGFFEMFSFPLVEGDRQEVLSEPGQVVLTQRMAQKYFGTQSALGSTVVIGEDRNFLGRAYANEFTVTGIISDPPENSSLQFDMLTSMVSYPEVAFFDWSWVWMQLTTFVRLTPDASVIDLEHDLTKTIATYAPPAFDRIGFSFNEMIHSGGRWNFIFQPFSDVYLGSTEIGNRLGPLGNRSYLVILGIIATLLLAVASINFMNLSTARSLNSAREVGIRKVLGATRRGLAARFITESLIFSLLALILAIGLLALALDPLTKLSGKHLGSMLSQTPMFPVYIVAAAAIVGLVAGIYPSVYLSRFLPISILRHNLSGQGRRPAFRNYLVVAQFTISVSLIIATIVASDQMDYLDHTDIGFDRADVMVISNQNHLLGDQADTFVHTIKKKADVLNASLSTGVPPTFGFGDYYKIEGKGDELLDLASYMVDDSFEETLGLTLVDGRGFSEDYSEASNVILNESAVRQFGWEHPIGKVITYPSVGSYTVVGVVKDFNFQALSQPISPFALFHRDSRSYVIPDSYVLVRIRTENQRTLAGQLKATWERMVPGIPFEYSFLDDNFADQYQSQRTLSLLFLILAILTIFVSCLGLLGLTIYTAERRVQEIGIRKTLGASIGSVVVLLTKDFVRWVLLANLIAWPLAFIAIERWLNTFAFRISPRIQPFILAGLVSLALALVTVVFHATKAALANPVDAIQSDG